MTGAGFSAGLERKGGGLLPDWRKLLASIETAMAIGAPSSDELRALSRTASTGPQLIELASMMSDLDPVRFAELVRAGLTPKPIARQPRSVRASWQRKHNALLALDPRGIVTMNIDELHEQALPDWKVVCPLDATAPADLRATIRSLDASPFILQAHGALTRPTPPRPHEGLVFTWEAYRRLMQDSAYTGFMSHLFTTCNFVFVGYGLSDLDFDQMLWADAARFGAATQDHIVIQRRRRGVEGDRLRATSAVYAKRYGIQTVWVTSWEQVPEVLEAAAVTAGPDLCHLVEECFSDDLTHRRVAHDALNRLGEAGKAIVADELLSRIRSRVPLRILDESIYSLGRLDPTRPATRQRITNALIKVALTDTRISPVAHALGTLQGYVDIGNLRELEEISTRIRSTQLRSGRRPEDQDPDDRLPIYAEYLVRRVRARHADEALPPRVDPPSLR